MIGIRYYAIFPKASLRDMLISFGMGADAAYPELFEKENSCRERIKRDAELKVVKESYATLFFRRLLEHSAESDRARLVELLSGKQFDNFWTVEVFEYSEKLSDLLADLDQTSMSHD
jgi:hypothetical protein